jgi:pfkB family carbohydrate kinase
VAVIIVIGQIVGRGQDGHGVAPAGPAAAVALAAAESGADVEVLTRIGDDPTGDAVLLALARAGVGHVATIRDAGHRTPLVPVSNELPDPDDDAEPTAEGEQDPVDAPILDAADVGLGLRYLTDYRVIVVVHLVERDVLREAAAAAGWATAHLVVVTPPGHDTAADMIDGALTITADRDAESVGALLGRYAAAVDLGEEPATAFAAFTTALA